MITADEWYDPQPDLTQFYQGDIVDDVPYFFFPNHDPESQSPKWKLLRPRFPLKAGETVEQAFSRPLPIALDAKAANRVDDRWRYPRGEYFVAVARKMRVMIVTRSCALDRNTAKHYLVAPVLPFAELPQGQRSADRLDSVRKLEKFDWFYLPEKDPIAEGFADLSQLMPVHWSFFGEAPSKNLAEPRSEDPAKRKSRLAARLTEYGRHKLEELLSDSYGVIFGFDHEDVVPQAAQYACSRCFYTGSKDIKRKTFTQEQVEQRVAFGTCGSCGERVTWVRVDLEQEVIAEPVPEQANR